MTQLREEDSEKVPLWAKLTIGALLAVVLAQSGALFIYLGGDGESSVEGGGRSGELTDGGGSDAAEKTDGLFHASPEEWDPMREIRRMQEEMDRIFEESFGRLERGDPFGGFLDSDALITPRTDVRETEDEYIVQVEMPGADDAEIEITLEDSRLTIEARSKAVLEEERQEEGGLALRRERQLGTFRREIQLPGPVDETSLSSEYEDGVLEVRIEKKGAGV